MKHALSILALSWALTASAASAACVAEYKAKRDNPLKLSHGTMTVPDSACTKSAAAPVVRAQLAAQGWTLLTILKVTQGG